MRGRFREREGVYFHISPFFCPFFSFFVISIFDRWCIWLPFLSSWKLENVPETNLPIYQILIFFNGIFFISGWPRREQFHPYFIPHFMSSGKCFGFGDEIRNVIDKIHFCFFYYLGGSLEGKHYLFVRKRLNVGIRYHRHPFLYKRQPPYYSLPRRPSLIGQI